MAWDVALTARDMENQIELLDNHQVDDTVRVRALRDVARANAYFGGTRVVLRELGAAFKDHRSETVTILDVGSGAGELGVGMRRAGARRAVTVKLFGLDVCRVLARVTRNAGTVSVCGDGLRLPFQTRSLDVVICSQVLHHFTDGNAMRLLRELDRVARRRVIVCDLRRSWVAAGGFWLASHPLRFHPVTRHDGVVSIRRGFTAPELARLVQAAVGHTPMVRRALGFRLAASWVPRHQPSRLPGRR
jgi:SAM-dependent methyltransferase